MFETNLEGDGFEASQLSNGIHEFRWRSTQRSAVDLWVAYNEILYDKTDPDDALYFLHVVLSSKFPPVSYVVRKAQQLQSKYRQHPKTRSAILFQTRFFGGFINTLSTLVNRKGHDITLVFAMDEREKAINWLLEQKQEDEN